MAQERASTVGGHLVAAKTMMTSTPMRRVDGKHVLWELIGLILTEKCGTDWTTWGMARSENGYIRLLFGVNPVFCM